MKNKIIFLSLLAISSIDTTPITGQLSPSFWENLTKNRVIKLYGDSIRIEKSSVYNKRETLSISLDNLGFKENLEIGEIKKQGTNNIIGFKFMDKDSDYLTHEIGYFQKQYSFFRKNCALMTLLTVSKHKNTGLKHEITKDNIVYGPLTFQDILKRAGVGLAISFGLWKLSRKLPILNLPTFSAFNFLSE